MKKSDRYVEVCDLPYCSEPVLFYQERMKTGLTVNELREKASRLFEKRNEELTMGDLKLAFLKLCPIQVNLGGHDHEVTIKKLNGKWILSCNCRAWVFNRSGDRRCKHTEHVKTVMTTEENNGGNGK